MRTCCLKQSQDNSTVLAIFIIRHSRPLGNNGKEAVFFPMQSSNINNVYTVTIFYAGLGPVNQDIVLCKRCDANRGVLLWALKVDCLQVIIIDIQPWVQ